MQLDLFGDAEAHQSDMDAKRMASGRVTGSCAGAGGGQHEQLQRVYTGLKHQLLIVRKQYRAGDEFTLTDIERSLRSIGAIFRPDSPRRILSELRKEGALNYEVVNRSQGLWRWM